MPCYINFRVFSKPYTMTSKRIKIILIVFSLVTTGIIAGIFIKNRILSQSPEKLLSLIHKNISLSIGKVHHVSIRNGVKEWILDAKSAHVVDESKQLMLEDVSMVYFLQDGSKVYLTAGRGILKTETNDIEAVGNVVLTYSTYSLETDKINYDRDRHVLFSSGQVKIKGKTVNLTADSMKYDLTTNQTWFYPNVEVMLRENSV